MKITFSTHAGDRVTVDGYCKVHRRLLSYTEYQSDICYWCRPELSPDGHKIRKATQEERDKLIPSSKVKVV